MEPLCNGSVRSKEGFQHLVEGLRLLEKQGMSRVSYDFQLRLGNLALHEFTESADLLRDHDQGRRSKAHQGMPTIAGKQVEE
jgi:hypothetical protein